MGVDVMTPSELLMELAYLIDGDSPLCDGIDLQILDINYTSLQTLTHDLTLEGTPGLSFFLEKDGRRHRLQLVLYDYQAEP